MSSEVNQETIIAQFLEWGEECKERNPSARELLQEFIDSYQKVRVLYADIESSNDMVLLQWGKTWPPGTTDIRGTIATVPYLDFTRQIVADETGEAEFDDIAIQMSITLHYESLDDPIESNNRWIESPEEIDILIGDFLLISDVARFLDSVPVFITYGVGGCG